jgi:undecaprenyl-diphosphatase
MMLLKYLVVVTAVTAVIGVAIVEVVSKTVTGPVLGVPMISLGCVLMGDGILITLARKRYSPTKSLKELGLKDFLVVGVAQGIAALPGVSRSGATVSILLLLGIKPEESFRLSFLALIPASVGATAATVLFTHSNLTEAANTVSLSVITLAILVTVGIGLVFINVLLKAAGSNKIALLTFTLGILAVFSGIVSILTGAG